MLLQAEIRPKAEAPLRHRTTGPAKAAVLAAGIGSFVLGVATLLAQGIAAVKGALNLWDPAGPLSGKAAAGVVAWLLSWVVLHFLWRDGEGPARGIWLASGVLIALGVILTFPPVFELAGH